MAFGDVLRSLIEEWEITQKELAAKLNVAPSTIGSYVQNVREPDFATLIAISRFFNVSTDYLLNNRTDQAITHLEAELLRIFRTLDPIQQEICLEQCRVFVKINHKEKANNKKSS